MKTSVTYTYFWGNEALANDFFGFSYMSYDCNKEVRAKKANFEIFILSHPWSNVEGIVTLVLCK